MFIMENRHENNAVRNFLKKKILQRREEQGLRSIDIDFKPKEISPMSEEEKEKERKRRESNRESAHRSRVKQKEEYERNNKLQQQLEAQKKQLLAVIRKYEDEKRKLVSQLCEKLPKELIQQTLENTNNTITAGILTESSAKHSDRFSDAAEETFIEDSNNKDLMETEASGSIDFSESTYFINSVCNYAGAVTPDTACSTEYSGNDMPEGHIVDLQDHNYYSCVEEHSTNSKYTFYGNSITEHLQVPAITRNTENYQELTVNLENIEGSVAMSFPGAQFLIYPYDANTDGDPNRDSSLLHIQVC